MPLTEIDGGRGKRVSAYKYGGNETDSILTFTDGTASKAKKLQHTVHFLQQFNKFNIEHNVKDCYKL